MKVVIRAEVTPAAAFAMSSVLASSAIGYASGGIEIAAYLLAIVTGGLRVAYLTGSHTRR